MTIGEALRFIDDTALAMLRPMVSVPEEASAPISRGETGSSSGLD
jgi:hypothetical protein